MIYYSPALLMQGAWFEILHVFVTGLMGVLLLSAAVQGWFIGLLGWKQKVVLFVAGIAMIHGSWVSDLIGIAAAALMFTWQRRTAPPRMIVNVDE
jgi:TRAP-type uncharacterized transport system fused permease subunit